MSEARVAIATNSSIMVNATKMDGGGGFFLFFLSLYAALPPAVNFLVSYVQYLVAITVPLFEHLVC